MPIDSFANVAATTTYGDNWADEPGVRRVLWEAEIPDRYEFEAYQDGAVVFHDPANPHNWLVVSANDDGVSWVDGGGHA